MQINVCDVRYLKKKRSLLGNLQRKKRLAFSQMLTNAAR